MNKRYQHPLYQEIDIDLASNNYVIVDPVNNSGLVYLTTKDYVAASQTWARTGMKVTVLHSPFSRADAEALKSMDLKGPSSDNKSKPLLGVNRILSKRSVLLNMLAGSWDDIKMISLTNSNGLGLLRFYLRMVIPLSMAKSLKDVSGKMWLTARFISYLVSLYHKHGPSYVVTYLKLNQLAISRAIGRQPLGTLRELDDKYIHRRLSRSGLPRFIPVGDRKRILSGSSRTIRYYLTIFGLYRVLQSPAVPKLSTITDPMKAESSLLLGINSFFLTESKHLLSIFTKFSIEDLNVSKWFNLKSSSSVSKVSWHSVFTSALLLRKSYVEVYNALVEYVELTQQVGKSIILPYFTIIEKIGAWIDGEYPSPFFKPLENTLRIEPSAGRLACKVEPAGKVRVFAMVDILTQNILHPLHSVLSRILKALPNDGTFDQEGMVTRAAEKAARWNASYCYDLSAATDRLPIMIQKTILTAMFNERIAELWKTILVDRPYLLPDNEVTRFIFKDDPSPLGQEFFYSTGQPMGALSSFNMLGITHHMIVQYSASLIKLDPEYYENGWCIAYEVLGDDIAIFQKDLAEQYLKVMDGLGVAINVKKSVIDVKGKTLELAKRTIHHGIDVSAISFKDILSSAPFVQRCAIVERVTRRATVKTHLAISILSQFYGENPSLRSSYMLLSLFLKGYNDKKVSLTDVFFLLFLMRKFSVAGLGSSMSFSKEFTNTLYAVVNKIYYQGLTSYTAKDNSLFPTILWFEYGCEFFSLILTLVPIIRSDLGRKIKEFMLLDDSVKIVESGPSHWGNHMSLDRGYMAVILGHIYSDNETKRHSSNMVYKMLPFHFTLNFIKDICGLNSLEKFKEQVKSINMPLVTPYTDLVPHSNPLDYLFLDKPRVVTLSDISSINVSCLDDLLYISAQLDTIRKTHMEVFFTPEITEPVFKPLADFSAYYDNLKDIIVNNQMTVPYIEEEYSTLYDNYMDFWTVYHIYDYISPYLYDKVVTIEGPTWVSSMTQLGLRDSGAN